MKPCCEGHFTMLAYSSQLWIQRPLNVQKNAAKFLANDIVEGFRKHRLELLCLCWLGEHEIGLRCRKNLRWESQDDLLRLIVRKACGGRSVVPFRSG